MGEIMFKQVGYTRQVHSVGGRDKKNMRELIGSCVTKTTSGEKKDSLNLCRQEIPRVWVQNGCTCPEEVATPTNTLDFR